MKKIFIGILALLAANSSFAQEAADKKFQAGIVFGAGMNFQKMNTRLMDNNGVGSDLLIGGNFNYMFHETVGLTSGLEFEFSTTKFKVAGSGIYYKYDDTKIVSQKNKADATNIYSLDERKQNSVYLTIPTMLIFRTNFIGYMRYYGKLGMRHSFLLSQNVTDQGSSSSISNPGFETMDNKHMKAPNEVLFYKGTVGIAGGAEWNFVGSTSLVAEIGFYYGITPLYYDRKNPYLYTIENDNGTAVDKYFSNSARQSQLQFKVSFLF